LLAAPTVTTSLRPDLFTTRVGTTGPHLVLLHGLFGSGKNWTSIAKSLGTDYRVTLVDLPNHGRSAWTNHFSYVETADLLADRLTEVDEPVNLIGHSMGGKVAMVVALRHPALIRRLVVVDVSPVRYERLSSFGRYVAGMRSLDLDTIADRVSADAALRSAVPDPGVRSFLLQNLRRDATGPGWRWQLNLAVLEEHLADIGDWPALGTEPYPGPVLWIAGANSDYVTPAYVLAMRAHFPRVQTVTVKNSGHWVHAEQPETFVATIRAFVHPT
jgi:esterase